MVSDFPPVGCPALSLRVSPAPSTDVVEQRLIAILNGSHRAPDDDSKADKVETLIIHQGLDYSSCTLYRTSD